MGAVPESAREPSGIVRVVDDLGRALGGGVLLGGEYVLTCASLLSAGVSACRVQTDATPARPPVRATVREFLPEPGLALLSLDRPLPAAAGTLLRVGEWERTGPVRIGLLDNDLAGNRRWWPAEPRSGDLVGLPEAVAPGPRARWCGAPVLDEDGRVVGLLTGFDRGSGLLRAATARTVVRHLPRTRDLAEEAPAGRFRLSPKYADPPPTHRLLTDPQVPEHRRWCGSCGEAVGRSRPGHAGRTEGYCAHCGSMYSFTPKLAAGDVVAGRYEILGCLARGGNGWIHLARDRAAGDAYVVLKGVLNTADEGATAYAVTEYRMLGDLEHPGIVRILDFVVRLDERSREQTAYIVMEYVAGTSLRELSRRGPRLAVVVDAVRQVLRILTHLHERNLLYCDMKPDNVILGSRGVTLIDLGAVRGTSDQVSPLIGTPGYQMSWEELEAHGPTVRSDILAVGRTLRELAEAAVDWSEQAPPPVAVESLRKVIERATAPYELRFASAEDMARQLDGVLAELRDPWAVAGTAVPSALFAPEEGGFDSVLGRLPSPARWFGASSRTTDLEFDPPSALSAGLPVPSAVRPPDERTGPPGEETRSPLDSALRACRADLAAGELTEAARGLDRAGALARAAGEDRWPVLWHRGLLAALEDEPTVAERYFADVYAAVPGEAAPKLALALCAEWTGRRDDAERFYAAVRAHDESSAAAAFGLARVSAARGERARAAAVLDALPAASPHRFAAEIGVIRVLAAALPAGPGGHDLRLPSPDDLRAALRRLTALTTPGRGDGWEPDREERPEESAGAAPRADPPAGPAPGASPDRRDSGAARTGAPGTPDSPAAPRQTPATRHEPPGSPAPSPESPQAPATPPESPRPPAARSEPPRMPAAPTDPWERSGAWRRTGSGAEAAERLAAVVWEAVAAHLALAPGSTLDLDPVFERDRGDSATGPLPGRLPSPLPGPLPASVTREEADSRLRAALLAAAARSGHPEERAALTEAARTPRGMNTRRAGTGGESDTSYTLSVSQEVRLGPEERDLHAVLSVRRSVSGRWRAKRRTAGVRLRLTMAPGVEPRFLRQALPPGGAVAPEPSARVRTAEYLLADTGQDAVLHLCLAVGREGRPWGEDLQVARVELLTSEGEPLTVPEPVVVHLTEPLPTAGSGPPYSREPAAGAVRGDSGSARQLAGQLADQLDDTVTAALDAQDRGDFSRGRSLLLRAYDLAEALGNHAMVRLLRNEMSRDPRHSRDSMASSASSVHRSSVAASRSQATFRRWHATGERFHGPGAGPGHADHGRRPGRHQPSGLYEPPVVLLCPRCDTPTPANALFCVRCGASLAAEAGDPPGPADPRPAPHPRRPPAEAGRSGPPPGGEQPDGPPPALAAAPSSMPADHAAPLARARVWCPDDTVARVGRPIGISFAMTAVPGQDGAAGPLAEPVGLRVLLESADATARPVTHLAVLRTDRSCEPVRFEAVPARPGLLVLHFRVYRDRDGQLLQSVRAELPVQDRVVDVRPGLSASARGTPGDEETPTARDAPDDGDAPADEEAVRWASS